MTDRSALREACAAVRPVDAGAMSGIRRHLDELTKPQGSLGRLEDLAARLALIYGDPPPPLARRVVFVLAADHGVARQGVSAYPPEVTAQMCRNYASGKAAINVIAAAVGAEVVAVDIGVDADLSTVSGLMNRKVRRGTADLSEGPALAEHEVLQALGVGLDLVRQHQPAPDVVALGEMGIGNTTSASAVTTVLTGAPVVLVVGRGTGISEHQLERKRQVVERAVARVADSGDPLRVLAEVGGLEIAGLAGVVLGAAALRLAVVTDGLIATAAALVAAHLAPPVRDYLIASHRSREPGHQVQLKALGLDPLFDLGLCLGEGTGAALALPLLEVAGALLRDMATFSSAGVSGAR